jgi:3-oxoacyl-[acyl-carrier protein] reductase
MPESAKMKVALITGASRGLGAEIAKRLGAAGWDVAVNCARDVEGATRVADSIDKNGAKAIVARFDVTDERAVRRGVAEIASKLGPIDLIVNNATGSQPVMPIEDQRWSHYLEQLKYFVGAPLYLLHAVLADWRRRNSGRIINIGSEVVDTGGPNFGHYVTAKAAMVGLTRSWAAELGKDGITVNLVAPGWTLVERHSSAARDEIEAYRRTVPLARMGLPEDVAGLVAFLASPAADFITGQTLAVNGGRTLA